MGSNDDQHDSLIPWFNTKEQEHRQAISYFQLLASTITIHRPDRMIGAVSNASKQLDTIEQCIMNLQ